MEFQKSDLVYVLGYTIIRPANCDIQREDVLIRVMVQEISQMVQTFLEDLPGCSSIAIEFYPGDCQIRLFNGDQEINIANENTIRRHFFENEFQLSEGFRVRFTEFFLVEDDERSEYSDEEEDIKDPGYD